MLWIFVLRGFAKHWRHWMKQIFEPHDHTEIMSWKRLWKGLLYCRVKRVERLKIYCMVRLLVNLSQKLTKAQVSSHRISLNFHKTPKRQRKSFWLNQFLINETLTTLSRHTRRIVFWQRQWIICLTLHFLRKIRLNVTQGMRCILRERLTVNREWTNFIFRHFFMNFAEK